MSVSEHVFCFGSLIINIALIKTNGQFVNLYSMSCYERKMYFYTNTILVLYGGRRNVIEKGHTRKSHTVAIYHENYNNDNNYNDDNDDKNYGDDNRLFCHHYHHK